MNFRLELFGSRFYRRHTVYYGYRIILFIITVNFLICKGQTIYKNDTREALNDMIDQIGKILKILVPTAYRSAGENELGCIIELCVSSTYKSLVIIS